MFRRISPGAIAALVAAAATLSAQQRAPPTAAPPASHADIGTLTMVNDVTSTLTVATLRGAVVTYRFDDETAVRGLIKCQEVMALRGREGEHVVVRFTESEGLHLPVAVSVEYLGMAPVHHVAGVVTRVDPANRVLVIEKAAGKGLDFDIGRRAPIDSPAGILSLTAFAAAVG